MMRRAECACGQASADCSGEPVRISVCHCLSCRRRSGSAFAVQARFPEEAVTLSGRTAERVRITDSGKRATYQFCPDCGATIAYRNEGLEGLIAIPVGAFADPTFPPPRFSVYEERRSPWLAITGDIERQD